MAKKNKKTKGKKIPYKKSKYKSPKTKKQKHYKAPEGIAPDLYDLYRHLAGKADKRLLRLEQLAQKNPEMYKNITKYAYAVAERAIVHWDGGKTFSKPRFDRSHPKTNEDIRRKVEDILHFLNLKTSTKGGIDKIYVERANSLNDEFGVNFTWQEWANFAMRGYFEYTDTKLHYRDLIKIASDQKKLKKMLQPYSQILKNKDLLGSKSAMDELKKELGLKNDDINLINKAKNLMFEDDKSIVKNQAKKWMQEYNLSYDNMFK